ncbi:MAG: type II toxin-antitoxin system RelE/ParE family toxin [Cyclobacteriaceae bacterium]
MDYLFQNHPFDQAEKVAEELRERARSLATYPRRGSLEPTLSGRGLEHRFILYRRTKRADIKIIYFIEKKQVFVTDFFPTEKDTESLRE